MSTSANFKVDPRLASLLGENYRSTELAIKELIDNSFDADASNVWVYLPKPLTDDPILIKDDGTGMTEAEVRHEYLNIASSRASRKGERTKLKNRQVKGRKGIGKFAGLMVASVMEVNTVSRAKETRLQIWRDELVKAKHDLEQIHLPIHTDEVADKHDGTEIVLRGINQNFTFPNPDKLKRLLVLEYGRQADFSIYVDDELVDIEDIPGDGYEKEISLKNGDQATIRYTISDSNKPLKQSGISIRVGGKIVGNPRYFGLDEQEEIPHRLLKRIYGEISADALEPDVTADWGSIIDNSKVLIELEKKVKPLLVNSFQEVFDREMVFARARLKKRINGSFDRLPDHRKAYILKVFDKILKKFYGESESRIASITSVVLDAFEKSDYWMVMQNLEEKSGKETAMVADAFSEFGMLDIAMIAQQSAQRLAVLKHLESLIYNPDTQADELKKALANNLWVLGNNYSMLATNPELESVMKMYLDHKYSNGHAHARPNLLLAQDFNKRFLLIDLKATDQALDLGDYRKAKAYIEDLNVYLPDREINVIVLGGALSATLMSQKANGVIQLKSFKATITDARNQLSWLINELQKN